jgi:hypothetical protein
MNTTIIDFDTIIETDNFFLFCLLLLVYFIYSLCHYCFIEIIIIVLSKIVYSLLPINIQQQYPIRPMLRYAVLFYFSIEVIIKSVTVLSHILKEIQ